MNNVVLIGRLVRDPELRYTQSGTATAQFTLAVDRNLSREKRQEMESKGQQTADFIRVVTWGKTAELCGNYLSKGKMTAVTGRIQTGSYTNQQGQIVYTTDVIAENIKFLEWGERSEEPATNNDNDFVPYNDNSKIPF
ncbi:single-stranded DNA-binding protein [Microaceticoccus formicicus]|uniref:single-stranded DNA-binding protein n=1 Tax=Microaceticoccus formicicus TaxID=3118105 RepID=UPI003CD0162F|nr:single-stranded DNA-binding protein [Peptoniphilaceae bacterium AMB_02]